MGSFVSVIIPTYGSAKYVCQAVDSALGQTHADLEVIVVDDGSTDDTRDRLERYGRRIRYIYQEHQGCSTARNEGIRSARGEYLVFLDADDIWLPQKLERQVAVLDQTPEVGLIYCWAYFINSGGQRIAYNGREVLGNFETGSRVFEQLLFRNVIGPTSGVTIRKDCVAKVGIFDQSLPYAEDRDLWMRISLRYQVAVVPEPLVCYRPYDVNRHPGYARQDYYVPVAEKVCSYLAELSGGPEAYRTLKRRALSHAHWMAAEACHQAGQDLRARCHLAQAALCGPAILSKKATLGLLMELTLGKRIADSLLGLIRRIRNQVSQKDDVKEGKCLR